VEQARTVQNIPLVDFSDWRAGGERRARFIEILGPGLERFGFVNVVNHGVSDALIADAYAEAAAVFALPEDVKRRYETPHDGRQRGYTPFAMEKAKDQAVGDLKEFWHIGRRVQGAGPIPPNQLPQEQASFGAVMQRLFDTQEAFALELLDAVCAYLGLAPGYFRAMAGEGNSVLRVIHYPDVGEAIPGAVRAAAHEDINLMTVLPAATQPGLELMTREGTWLAVNAPPGAMVCDTGDMMALVTNGRLPATTHRVVNPPAGGDGGRFSMPFFLHPAPDVLLAPLSGDTAPIRAHDFLLERLRANGVA
jgi:isopenicillin N synthase-like dioxygenase